MNYELRIKNKTFGIKNMIHDSCFMICKSRGFTVVEMLIYMGLLSILLLVMVDLFASSLDVQLESQSSSGVDQDAKFMVARLSADIKRATSILEPALGSTPSGILKLVIDGITYTYATASGGLTIASGSATHTLNSYETTTNYATFGRYGNMGGKNAIKIMLTIKSKTSRSSGQEIRNIETAVGIR